ncbi:vacuolar amino acid transporter, putative [Pediculus humanus corporis]|uniref:Vacuolar amino acid transporter, putative n=1 Tax=Pediculus humanus subsp. corporis TaxID=121224 RepID=E0V9U9_PEDHC|nr:vacuolar amino acid transporter, putative [Pediculus humanus corporis]EEB10155.1 vacuolar amino acid transporter, putative [Pediculus humanus corporis]
MKDENYSGGSRRSRNPRDPIWTCVAGDPRITQQREYVVPSTSDSESAPLASNHVKGLSVTSAAVFIAGEMAGSGVLALPRAVVDAGACWEILEERYLDYRQPVRNPYATIAFRAVGPWARKLVSFCIQFTLFGAGTVYLLLAAQIVKDLLDDYFPNFGLCIWFLIISIILMPAMWFGSPKDFRVVGIGALLTTAIACVLIFTQIVLDGLHNMKPVKRKVHGFYDFFVSFGTILFAFGGASTFPTIQNDMINKEKFSKSVFIAFSVILGLYVPVTFGGYIVYGEMVTPNIILSLGHTSLVKMANILMAIHLVLAFLIVINPVCQELEEHFKIPMDFGIKRCLIRSGIMLTMVFVGETIPRFRKILALVGGSTITLLTFVFPALFYMLLCRQHKLEWPERSIPLHIRLYLWELIIIGVIGGTASSYSAILSIFSPDAFSLPCYWIFS